MNEEAAGNRPIKIGYAMLRDPKGQESYIAFKELSFWEENQIVSLKESLQTGEYELYCACSPENDIPLSITANNVIRVKNNLQQDKHRESCPKSIRYAAWLKENKTCTEVAGEDGNKVVFQITLPGVGTGSSSSGSSSSENSKSQPKMTLYNMVKNLNAMAWEKQTYSLKKKIREARKEGRSAELAYKDIKAFSQLIYGVSHDIYIMSRNNTYPLTDLYYRPKEFFACDDFKKRFFVYAQLDEIKEYRAERKYQYLVLRMPGNMSPYKTSVRITTDQFQKIFDTENLPDPQKEVIMAAGWMNHSVYLKEDGTKNEWANLLQAAIFRVSEQGLFAESRYEANLINRMCKEPIIFKKPYEPIENYGSVCPSLMIENRKGKNIIIDILNEKIYQKRLPWANENEEFSCILVKEEDDIEKIIDIIRDKMK